VLLREVATAQYYVPDGVLAGIPGHITLVAQIVDQICPRGRHHIQPDAAHAGDGNVHPIIVFDPADDAVVARARRAFDLVMELAIGLGGTITGEHGVGRLKRDWLPKQLGPEVVALTRRIKDALDPHGILNPCAMLP
jgi:FAD/FMN-containing dehydrogenase